MTSFREAMRAEVLPRCCKLFDLSRADIQLSSDDLNIMAARTRLADPLQSGPIALLLGNQPSLLVDMAILLKNRVGNRRRLRLFTSEVEARLWLTSEADPISSALAPHRAEVRLGAPRRPWPASASGEQRGGS